MPILEIGAGPNAGKTLPILDDRLVISRHLVETVVNALASRGSARHNPSVSRIQAIITCNDGNWYIQDGDGEKKKSRNGTYLNDKKLPDHIRRPLRDGDRICICDIHFIFRLEAPEKFTVEAAVGYSDVDTDLDAQSARRLRLLLEIGTALRGTLDEDAILDRALEHLFKMFAQAERGLVVFRDKPEGSLVLHSLRTPGGEAADRRFSTSVIRRCVEEVEAVLGNDLPGQFPDSESIGLLASLSLMCTPLWSPDGLALGAIQLDSSSPNGKFTPDDLRLLLGVASQVSIALSNARLHREALAHQSRARDLEVAQQVQRALLPRSLPEVGGYAFYAHYESAEAVGGDYFDFIHLPDGRLVVLLGDVAGKGVPAALVAAKFSVEARVCLETIPDPAAAVDRLNALMIKADVPEKFVTLVVAVFDPAAHAVAIVNAGHPSPYLLRASGAIEEATPPEIVGCPIGVLEGQALMSRELYLEPGDRLLAFSDGVSEAMDIKGKLFGKDRVRSALGGATGGARATGEKLLEAVKRHAAGCAPSDDITVVCFGRVGI